MEFGWGEMKYETFLARSGRIGISQTPAAFGAQEVLWNFPRRQEQRKIRNEIGKTRREKRKEKKGE